VGLSVPDAPHGRERKYEMTRFAPDECSVPRIIDLDPVDIEAAA